MANSPISLIQWLKPDEESREAKAALAIFAAEVSIYHDEVQKKADAKRALEAWFRDSIGNAQYCFLGAHGIVGPEGRAIGLGSSNLASEFAYWSELWDWFLQGDLKGGLWLGACKSGDAAAALSPLLHSGKAAIPWIYGFSDGIYPVEIEAILVKLIEFTRLDHFSYLDEELALLRSAVTDTKIELYYPAFKSSGRKEYMSVDEMPEKIGKTFHQLLVQNASC